MISVAECKKYLKNDCYSDKQIEGIRDAMQQLADVLVTDYLYKKESRNGNKKTDRSEQV